ncbi:MAG: RidA family protein [Gammaproteobacteria bacterium]|jgi:enamine deaminase RidA (YjgF/YER057c/UK114 family)|nr:RidA family protein [Gammaproteobacteria bacterium]MBT4492171.1 RidA family protein [Gammaproteobacteria bacterium]
MSTETIVTASSKTMYDQFHFADAVVSNGHILCSGVLGTGEGGKEPTSILEEFQNAWRRVGEVLAEAGADYSDIIEYTSYHVGLQANLGDFMKARDEVISEPWPAWTAIGITELAVPGAHVEIRVTAVKPD